MRRKNKSQSSVAVIGIVGVPGRYGGFETLVENIVLKSSLPWTVYCSYFSYKQRSKFFGSARCVYLPLRANGIMSVFYDAFAMLHASVVGHRVFLILGVSGAIILPILRVFCRDIKMVVNIDGIEWRREKWGAGARWFLRLSEKIAVEFADEVIADNQVISDYILDTYDRPSKVIAYGGDHVIRSPSSNAYALRNSLPRIYSFALCRIEPENNVEKIIEASCLSKTNLVFVGNWDASAFGRSLLKKYGDCDNLFLLNPIYDLDVLYVLRSECRIYIHGHSAGGTNPSLVEALYIDRPIIAFDCDFNRSTLNNVGKFFNTAEELAAILGEDVKSDIIVPEAITRLRDKYTWKAIRAAYLSLLTTQFSRLQETKV